MGKGLTRILSRDLNEVRKQVVVEECSRQQDHQGKGPKMKICSMCFKKQDSHCGQNKVTKMLGGELERYTGSNKMAAVKCFDFILSMNGGHQHWDWQTSLQTIVGSLPVFNTFFFLFLLQIKFYCNTAMLICLHTKCGCFCSIAVELSICKRGSQCLTYSLSGPFTEKVY